MIIVKTKKPPPVEERIGSPILSPEEDNMKNLPEEDTSKSDKIQTKIQELSIDRLYSDSDEEREYQVCFCYF